MAKTNFVPTVLENMPQEDQIEIFKAWVSGIPLQVYDTTTCCWLDIEVACDFIRRSISYRKSPAITGPFEGLSDTWKWIAMDKDKRIFLYETKPGIDMGFNRWIPIRGGSAISINKVFSGVKVHVDNWEDSLTKLGE